MLTISSPPVVESKPSRWSLGRLARLAAARPNPGSPSTSPERVKHRRIHTPPQVCEGVADWESQPSREALRHALRQIRDEDNGAFVQISSGLEDGEASCSSPRQGTWSSSASYTSDSNSSPNRANDVATVSTASSQSGDGGTGKTFVSSPRSPDPFQAAQPVSEVESEARRRSRIEAEAPLCMRTSPLFQDPPQHSLNKFEVLDTLGTGTFGRVLLVRLRSRPRSDPQAYYALKVLKKSDVLRLKQVAHTNNERYVLSHLQHPFIVNLFCTYQDNVNCYMLMEYVVGGEIFSHLRRARRFSVDQTRFYIACLVLALAHMHANKVLYRDLKPENLLLDRQGYVKLTDFGFSKELRSQDRTWTLCGTPEYLSPEVIQSQGQSFATDFWALGVLAYEMLCGHPPFYDSTPFGTYEKILQAPLTFPKHVDVLSRHLISSLLTRDVSKRLGNLRGGVSDVMRHPWFEGVDWAALLHKRIDAPIVPKQAFAGDTCNFERYSKALEPNSMPALQSDIAYPSESASYDPVTDHLFIDF